MLYLFFIFPLDLAPADPIAQLHRCFCRKLLERAVHTLIQPQSDSDTGKRKNDSGWGRDTCDVYDSLMRMNYSGSVNLFPLPVLRLSFREFSSALEFLQLLNSCTEDSPSPPPPFSTPPSHTTTPGMNSMKRSALPSHKEAWITSDVCVWWTGRLTR